MTAKSNDRWEPTQDNYVAEVAPCLTQNYGKQPDNSDTNAGPMLVAFGWNKSASQTLRVDGDTAPALQGSPSSNPAIAFSMKDHCADAGEICPTLRAGGGYGENAGVPPAIAYQCQGSNVGEMGTLRAGNGSMTSGIPFVATSAVRRLTPIECERLQGFPDDYTLVSYRNKPATDGPHYKALGNSMAVPVMRWIGERIAMVEQIVKEREDAA